MELQIITGDFTVCKTEKPILCDKPFMFSACTDEELSLVCKTENVPKNTLEREDGWRGIRITGILDFSLIGILAEISAVLAKNKIGIFVVSTYNTDYIFVKCENFEKALHALKENGYKII